MDLSQGGLVAAWQRLGEVLTAWHDQIGEQVKGSGVLHADETGWRVNGKPHWLWCFTTKGATYYMIDRSRGSPALKRFFTEALDGVLITDFWSAYGAVSCAEQQACLAHLLRELAHVDERDESPQWRTFSKKLKRLLRDGLGLKAHSDLPPEQRKRRTHLIDRRLMCLVECDPFPKN
jgi:transposase